MRASPHASPDAPKTLHRSRRWCAWAACAILLFATAPTFAHPESLSALRVAVHPGSLAVTLTLCKRDLGKWFPPIEGREYTTLVVEGLQREADQLVEVQCDDIAAPASSPRVRTAGPGTVIVELTYKIPERVHVLEVRSAHLANLPAAHQQLLCIEDERVPGDEVRVLLEDALTTQQDSLSIELPDAPTTPVTRPTH